jgi:hypothetical protein
MLCHQLLYSREWFGARLYLKVQIVQNVRDGARRFLIWTEE